MSPSFSVTRFVNVDKAEELALPFTVVVKFVTSVCKVDNLPFSDVTVLDNAFSALVVALPFTVEVKLVTSD